MCRSVAYYWNLFNALVGTQGWPHPQRGHQGERPDRQLQERRTVLEPAALAGSTTRSLEGSHSVRSGADATG